MNKHEEVKIVMLVSWDRLYLMNVLVARQLHYSQKDKFIAISQQEYEESKTYLNEHDIYCLDELLNTEKELEEEKKQHQYDNKYMNEVVKGLTDKTLEVVKMKLAYAKTMSEHGAPYQIEKYRIIADALEELLAGLVEVRE